MFHLRWSTAADCRSAAVRALESIQQDGNSADEAMLDIITTRMKGRKERFVGVSESTEAALETSFREVVTLLEAHLKEHRYLLGARVTFADFALFGQLYCLSTDITGGKVLRDMAPSLMRYISLLSLGCPRDCTGPVAQWDKLEPTLLPVLQASVAGWFLPWASANVRACTASEDSFSLQLPGEVTWSQRTSKFQSKTMQRLQNRYATLAQENPQVASLMDRCGCRRFLEPPMNPPLSRL